MSFIYGIILGFFTGTFSMWNYMKKKVTHHYHIKIDAKAAADFIESDEIVKQLKKELDL